METIIIISLNTETTYINFITNLLTKKLVHKNVELQVVRLVLDFFPQIRSENRLTVEYCIKQVDINNFTYYMIHIIGILVLDNTRLQLHRDEN